MGIESSDGTRNSMEERTPDEILIEIRELNVEVELARRTLEKQKTIFGDNYGINYIAYDEDCWTDSLRDAHKKYWGLVDKIRILKQELERSLLGQSEKA